MTALLLAIAGILAAIVPLMPQLIQLLSGSQLSRDQYRAQADAARATAEGQENAARETEFGKEFEHVGGATWFDSIIDALNRLPRPVMAFGTIAMFAYAVFNPAGFTATAVALNTMPQDGWLVLGAIVTFFFGGRMLDGWQSNTKAIPATAARTSAAQPRTSPTPTPSVEKWKQAQAGGHAR